MKQYALHTAGLSVSWLLALLAMSAVPSLSAQTVFRIVGADGKITFSDKPPATTAASQNVTATSKSGKPLELASNTLPFELRAVATRFPVTLYSAATCTPCANGRNLLASRGIPFSERTITTSDDNEALARIAGDSSLPFLTIGGQKIKGYSDTEWTQFLDAAGYPPSSKLPGNYRNPPAAPLVAVQSPAAPGAQAESESQAAASPAPRVAPPPPAPPADNPTGIRF